MTQNNSNDQEIDLGLLINKIKDFFNSILDLIFDFLLFIKKNIILILLLLIFGAITGVFLSKASKSYDHKVIVSPNFKSIEYIQNKIDLLNSKIIEKDSDFFNSINLSNYQNIRSIKIEPVTDVFDFIGKDNIKLDVIKLLANNENIEKVLKENTISQYYHYQLIEINTSKIIERKEIIDPILKYINDSEYYDLVKQVALKTAQEKIRANDSTIASIDRILNSYSKNSNDKANSVFYSNNTQLADIIEQKNILLNEQTNLKIDLINEVNVIKEISTTTNIVDIQKNNSNLIYLLPTIFISIFIFIKVFINFYKSQIKKRNLS